MIRIKASVAPAHGNDILSVIRMPFVLCARHRREATSREIIASIPQGRMEEVYAIAHERTGASPNPDRTDVFWVKINGAG